MKGESIKDRRLRAAGIEPMQVTPAFLAAFEERTCGFLEARWPVNPDYMQEAIKQYGLDCYTQGLLDASASEVKAAIDRAVQTEPET